MASWERRANIPFPGGIGGVDAGLVGTFALYHQPLAATAAAVLDCHAVALWIPALLGTVAFVQLSRSLRREDQPAAIYAPLAEPIDPRRSRLARQSAPALYALDPSARGVVHSGALRRM